VQQEREFSLGDEQRQVTVTRTVATTGPDDAAIVAVPTVSALSVVVVPSSLESLPAVADH
jgi:hypothetical protein